MQSLEESHTISTEYGQLYADAVLSIAALNECHHPAQRTSLSIVYGQTMTQAISDLFRK